MQSPKSTSLAILLAFILLCTTFLQARGVKDDIDRSALDRARQAKVDSPKTKKIAIKGAISEPIKDALAAGLRPLKDGIAKERYIRHRLRAYGIKVGYQKLASIGKLLYFDPRLSKDFVSCNSCHRLGLGGSVPLAINPPSSLNAFNAKIDVAHFFKGGGKLALDLINNNPSYLSHFKLAYGNKVIATQKILNAALLGYLATLLTPTRLDDFLLGNLKALSISEVVGLGTFIKLGCAKCHNGVNLGRPTLRNILQTAPYLRQNIYNLKNAVFLHARMEGIDASLEAVQSILVFFKALEGKKDLGSIPELPEASS